MNYSEVKMIQKDSRTKINLENYLRMAFLPTGIRDFMKGVNHELELGQVQSQINLGIGTAADIVKYLPYFAAVYNILK